MTTQQQRQMLIGILLLMTISCSRQVKKPLMPTMIPSSFSTTGTEPLPDSWWESFKDEKLDFLIQQALKDNFNLAVAWDRLAQAQAVAKKSNTDLLPQADLEAGFARTRQESRSSSAYSSLYTLGIAAGYEVDLWSQIRSLRQAAWLDVEAEHESVNTAAITLSASIASTWYQLAEAKAMVRIANEQIKTNRQVLDIVTVQFRKGVAAAADVLRQRQLVASTEAQLISAEEDVELLQYQLSVLLGHYPESGWRDTAIDLPELPPIPKLGVPTEVLWRRPDIRQNYRKIQAADQRLAAAIADQYPSINLVTTVETSASSVNNLFDDWLANLIANAVQPLFDGNLRKLEVERQNAIVSERIRTWGQTILDALEEIESALTRERQQKLYLESLKLQLDLANETYERNRERYIKGQTDYIRVLESIQSLQSLQRNVLTAQRTLIGYRIDLYRSIAGSFDLPQPTLTDINNLTGSVTISENIVQ
ncbi:MAG: TolC family protein [Sedimentisphaerales bacterium]|nr:TolC family protein [Sedimentisphaerales bacterium]